MSEKSLVLDTRKIKHNVLEDELFFCLHILDVEDCFEKISNFRTKKDNARALEDFLKKYATLHEHYSIARTYLLVDKETDELVCFFTLKAGMISTASKQHLLHREFDAIPGIELAVFAVNNNYCKNHPEIKGIGKIALIHFILPIVRQVSSQVGAQILYIFALPEQSLIEHYKELKFKRLERKKERIVHRGYKPRYDKSCIFMYQIL